MPCGGAAVEQGLHGAVRDAGGPRRRAACRPPAAGPSRACPVGDVARPDEQQAEDRRAVALRRQERQRRRAVRDDHDPELVGRVGRELAQEPQDLRRLRRAARRPARRARAARPGAGRTRTRWRCRSCRRRRAGPRTAPARSRASTRSRSPSAVTRSTARRLSTVRPCRRMRCPKPPPSVSPPMPGVADRPARGGEPVPLGGEVELATTARPPAARATRAAGSTDTAFMSERSIITPSSQTAWPATEWPPPRTETGRSRSRAKRSASDHVVGAGAARDQRRPAVDRAVPDPPGLVVALLAGAQQRAAEAGPQLGLDRRCSG